MLLGVIETNHDARLVAFFILEVPHARYAWYHYNIGSLLQSRDINAFYRAAWCLLHHPEGGFCARDARTDVSVLVISFSLALRSWWNDELLLHLCVGGTRTSRCKETVVMQDTSTRHLCWGGTFIQKRSIWCGRSWSKIDINIHQFIKNRHQYSSVVHQKIHH